MLRVYEVYVEYKDTEIVQPYRESKTFKVMATSFAQADQKVTDHVVTLGWADVEIQSISKSEDKSILL